ncbi:hypothetical protein PLICRDRAFT_291564 [Plicaturopsis crispa FD-325 SS-3]|nr:hypothetical protein PLICRDRAFT_291564 [Plicaturopsis crispa FD-325 SS-3]
MCTFAPTHFARHPPLLFFFFLAHRHRFTDSVCTHLHFPLPSVFSHRRGLWSRSGFRCAPPPIPCPDSVFLPPFCLGCFSNLPVDVIITVKITLATLDWESLGRIGRARVYLYHQSLYL